jgi:hypothetical protein
LKELKKENVDMAIKSGSEKENGILNLYNLPIDMGKQMFGNSNMGNLNFGTIQKNWQEYSEIFSQEMNNLWEFDENYYKNMSNLWSEFSKTINTGMVKLNGFEKENYTKWYKTWLTDIEDLGNNYNSLIEKQLKDETNLFNIYEPFLLKFGYKEKDIDVITELFQVTSKNFMDMWNNSMGLFTRFMNSVDSTELFDELQKYSDIWQQTNINILKYFTDTSIIENLKEQYQEQNQSFFKMFQQLISTTLENFNLDYLKNFDKSNTELPEMKKKIEELTQELESYKSQSTSKPKKGD